MALLDRVKERTETDLTDGELTSLIAEAQAEIRERYGPDRSVAAPIAVSVDGGSPLLNLTRPLDAAQTVSVVEYVGYGFDAPSQTTLAADDYRVRNGGRSLLRLSDGTNARSSWGDRVVVTYVPVDDQPQRDEVTIKLVILALQYEGVERRHVGDVTTDHSDYQRERERLLGSLTRPLLMA